MKTGSTQGGFTLLEVMVAVAILAISFSVVMNGMSTSLRTTVETEGAQRRMDFARLKLAQIDLVPTLRIGDTASGRSDDDVAWRIEILPYIAPDTRFGNLAVVRIALELQWDGRSGVRTWTIHSYRVLAPAPEEPRPLAEQLNALG